MQFNWWQLLIVNLSGILVVLLGVLLGGLLVFKTRTITMPTRFFGAPGGKKAKGASSYMSDDLRHNVESVLLDEDLSPAAARLRAQKSDPLSIKQSTLNEIKGGKK